jgi:hypothetical protein
MRARSFAVALVAAGLVSFAVTSHAALLGCPSSFTTSPTAKVENLFGTSTAVNGCQYIAPSDQNNVASLANVNAAGFFDHGDWQSNGQTQKEDFFSSGLAGLWSIANVDFAAFDYMIVFKDGRDTNLIAFSFNELFSFGSWSSPFQNPPFENLKQTKEVSHLSIFRRGGEQQVSEPGILGLFGIGLLALGFLRRKQIGLGFIRRRTVKG